MRGRIAFRVPAAMCSTTLGHAGAASSALDAGVQRVRHGGSTTRVAAGRAALGGAAHDGAVAERPSGHRAVAIDSAGALGLAATLVVDAIAVGAIAKALVGDAGHEREAAARGPTRVALRQLRARLHLLEAG